MYVRCAYGLDWHLYPPVSLWAKGDPLEETVAMVEVHQLNVAGVGDAVMTSASVDERRLTASRWGRG